MINFLINRREWFRGKDSAVSKLKIPEKDWYCCLGLIARDCGIADTYLEEARTPIGINLLKEEVGYTTNNTVKLQKLKEIFPVYFHIFLEEIPTTKDFLESITLKEVTRKLMEINDEKNINDLEREERLTKLFHLLNIEPVFYN